MIFEAPKGRYVYGVPIGILMFEINYAAVVPGAVVNASSYDFPIFVEQVHGIHFEDLYNKNRDAIPKIVEAAKRLEQQGVRAITSTCGFFGIFQKEIADAVSIPVFLSSLLQLPFMNFALRQGESIGVVTAKADSFDEDFLKASGAEHVPIKVAGLEDAPYFSSHVIREEPVINTEEIEKEVLGAVLKLVKDNPDVSMILLECSELPPYAKKVQDATGLPVFDFNTMINYIVSTVVRREFHGMM